jgi:hypothetical protein
MGLNYGFLANDLQCITKINTLHNILAFPTLNIPKAFKSLKGLTHKKSIKFIGFYSITQTQITLTHKIILGLGT